MPKTYSVPNPYYAEVLFTLGDFDLTPIPPKYLKQFTYERNTDSSIGTANKFTLSVFDSPGLELEDKISKGLKDCKFQYGYSRGNRSKVYSGVITYYDADFTPGGVLINIEGISSAVSSLGMPRTKSYKDGLISDYVKQIAEEEGWNIGYIEETLPVSDGESKNKKFRRNNIDAINFIKKVLIPESKSKETNEGGYIMYFDDLEDGPYLYYCTPNWKNKNSKKTGSEKNSSEDEVLQFEFEVGYAKDSNVISFNPEYSGLLTAVMGSKEVNAKTVDSLRNEMFSVKVNKDTDSNRAVLGDKSLSTTYNTTLCNSSASVSELQNLAANMWYANAAQSYPATLECLGNPNIEPQTYCSILVTLLGGYPHRSSGIYLITSVVDDIMGGTFTSKLQLIRNGLNVGTDENGGLLVTASVQPQINTTVNGTVVQPGSNVNVTGVGNADIVKVGVAEVGYVEGSNNNTKYGVWYGLNYQPWCAMFVSWCANQAGISETIIPKYASCDVGMNWFKKRNRFQFRGSYTPKQGDIVFFGSPNDSTHTGIVISSDRNKVYTVEGNTSDKVAKRSYNLTSSYIVGYGVPAYTGSIGSTNTSVEDATSGEGNKTT